MQTMLSRSQNVLTGCLAALLMVACTQATQSPGGAVPTNLPSQATGPVVTLRWNTTATEDDQGNPQTAVRLEISGVVQRTLELGTYLAGDAGTWKEPVAGALSVRHLWWGGAGDLIGVFHEGSALVVKRREIGEGAEDLPWITLGKVELPRSTPILVMPD